MEISENRLVIQDKVYPHGDIALLKHLLNEGKATAFRLMELTGKQYVQYVQYRLRVLVLNGIVLRCEERGKYEINPEIKDELVELFKNAQ